MTGIICVNKPQEFTSFDVVASMRRCFGTKKIGHGGTLDPMATGVLPIFVGNATKACDIMPDNTKSYRAGFRLGQVSDTQDVTGTILAEYQKEVPQEDILAVIPEFTGKILQLPPMYSAVQVNGKRLYDLARQGIEVEREARKVRVFSLDITPTDRSDEYILDAECSGGTYIRTLCADIGAALGCGGAMASLERRLCGGFDISESFTVETLGNMTEEERLACLRPVESLFCDLPELKLAPFYERLCRSGCEIYQKKIGTAFPVGERLRISGKNGFFALGEVRDYPDGSAVKTVKLFEL